MWSAYKSVLVADNFHDLTPYCCPQFLMPNVEHQEEKVSKQSWEDQVSKEDQILVLNHFIGIHFTQNSWYYQRQTYCDDIKEIGCHGCQ